MNRKNIKYYLSTALTFVLLKLIFKFSAVNDLQFILSPTSKIVAFISNSSSVFISEQGYFHENLNILINKSCSGFNFWILCFTLIMFSLIRFLQTATERVFAFFTVFFGTFLLTLLVNSSRIIISVWVSRFITRYPFSTEWLHQATGSFVYLFFLISIYLLFNYSITKLTSIKNEKSAQS